MENFEHGDETSDETGATAKGKKLVLRLGVDEKAIGKGQNYMTMVCDVERGTIEHVSDGRTTESLEEYYRGLSKVQLQAVKSVSMDMWRPYFNATMKHIPNAQGKIVYDRFHIAMHANAALEKERRAEQQADAMKR